MQCGLDALTFPVCDSVSKHLLHRGLGSTLQTRHATETALVLIAALVMIWSPSCIFQEIFYLAKTITLPLYKLCNHSLKSQICFITPSVPENTKEVMAVLVSTAVFIENDELLRQVIPRGQNLAEFFPCDVWGLHLLLVLNLALLLCSPNKQSVHAVKQIKPHTLQECKVKDMLTAGRSENGF